MSVVSNTLLEGALADFLQRNHKSELRGDLFDLLSMAMESETAAGLPGSSRSNVVGTVRELLELLDLLYGAIPLSV